jgi:hypothetical protein
VNDEDDVDLDYADDEEEWDEFEEAVQECGLLPAHLGGGCMNAGTEHCDFDCPFRDNPELLTGDDDD